MGILFFLFLNSLINFQWDADKKFVFKEKPVLVTASRIPLSLQEVTRSVAVITSEEISQLPVNSVPELLSYLVGTDMRQRNFSGVQADASIRGSSFEQVMVLLDGVNITDPQTGHHNFNLPLDLDDVERIEILRGHASSLFGPNAFAGVINIIPKQSSKKKNLRVSSSFGSFGSYSLALSPEFSTGNLSSRLSFVRRRSDGHREGTDFNIRNIFARSLLELENIGASLIFGYNSKDFGASNFYAPFPSFEKTRTFLTAAKLKFDLSPKTSLNSNIFYRQHKDKFILIRENPDFYTNNHTTDKYGGEIDFHFLGLAGEGVLGIEFFRESINSTGLRSGVEGAALGQHSRNNISFYTEYQKTHRVLLVNLGARLDYNSQYGRFFSPALNLGYIISKDLKIRACVGKSFRAPTFTELYYLSPANVGNPSLKVEQAWSGEVGLDYSRLRSFFSLTLFLREGKNIIDWVRPKKKGENPWQAMNISEILTKGLEASFKFSLFPGTKLEGNYCYLSQNSKIIDSLISKYAYNPARHEINLILFQELPLRAKLTLTALYRDRMQTGSYFLLNGQISQKLSWLTITLRAVNVLDKRYQDIFGVEMPGRWISLSVEVDF